MKITKSQLKQIIKEELGENFNVACIGIEDTQESDN